jgi:hypothetical protein
MLYSANSPLKVAEVLTSSKLALRKEGAILVEGVVLVACVSSRVGIATCAHMNVPLPASCRYEAVANVLRNVLF